MVVVWVDDAASPPSPPSPDVVVMSPSEDDVVVVVVVVVVSPPLGMLEVEVVVVVVVVVVLEVVEGVVVHVGCTLDCFNVSGSRRFWHGHSSFGLEHVSITTRVSVPPQSEPSAFVVFHPVKVLYV